MKAHVIIYTRPGCHLCELAQEAIEQSGCRADFELETVNIELDAELLARYGDDIPVVTINGREAFKHRVNSKLFKAAIAQVNT